jgi:Phage capsid family
MNFAERPIIPLRPDPTAVAIAALRSVARAALHAVRSAGSKNPERHPWRDDAAVDLALRSPVSPAKPSEVQALAQVRAQFLPSLMQYSAAAAVLDQTLQLSLDGAASVSLPAVSIPTAGFVSPGQAIPVLQGTATAAASLAPSKLATLIALTREMVDANGEVIMTQVLRETVGASLDAAFFSANAAVPETSPAGILNGLTPIAASPAGQNPMVTDLANLAAAVASVAGNGQILLVAAAKQATAIRLITVDPPPTYTSSALASGTVIAIVPEAIASSVDAPNVRTSIETTLHMSTPAGELVSSPGAIAAPSRSIFQTDALAVRLTMDASWTRRGAGVAWIEGANWP